ncbi:ElyC/SanA/YdcF family protein [Granulicella arctica]|uniref:Uncharacterized SAM-binding protein YcdF (DUF218 family) n=1 Tax=Granulicella arctica TaxID=940613 RepID=A0A7Y9TGQ6_9BACT|nr:uncharacterized SAM-binding protein YcdF (DUF218 family) [Granulicella arctica]
MKTLVRIVVSLILLVILIVAIDYRTIPSGDTAQPHFDTLIVLGYPANLDGTPSPEQRERVLEGVREYKTGIAPRLIMTGGAAHNQFTEAHVMAQFAEAQGVPASVILEEDQAQNTIQNIYYSAQIMHQHDWHSAEIVSSPSHLPRASLIMQTFNRVQPTLSFDWHTHPAPWPAEYSLGRKLAVYSGEAWYCLKLRIYGFPASKFLPS